MTETNGSGSPARETGASPATPKIRVRDLHKAFGTHTVLDGLDLDVGEQESVVVIGGSGTGKSVLLKCILGILEPDAGTIEVDGQNVVGLRGEARDQMLRKFGMLFQNAALFDSLTVWENVSFALIQRDKMDKQAARRAAVNKLAQVGLGEAVADLYPAELSGGMKKRVGLARAIATDPEIIFFDEPTTGLDPIMGDVINDLIVSCVHELGASTLSITHDMASARKIAHRVAMLYAGEIIWQGPVAEVDTTDNPYVQQFVHGRAEGPIRMPVRQE
jgi:phospholipid/cholesterol/gamma-HCH transport system ATP-binding protein